MLPGSGPSNALGVYVGTAEYSNHSSWYVVPIQTSGPNTGTIKNQLLSQTITLYFNLSISGNHLGDIAIGDSLVIADATCGSSTPIPGTNDTVVLDHTVVTYLADASHGYPNTVQGLFQLANDMLGGKNTGLSLDAVQSTVEKINSGFDKCRVLVAYLPYHSTNGASGREMITQRNKTENGNGEVNVSKLNVSAYPNPYSDKVRFIIQSSVSGQGTLEVYNTLGQKIQTVFKGYVFASRSEIIDYDVPALRRANLVYVLRIGDKQVAGKVLHIE
jgi:hypothetical protein